MLVDYHNHTVLCRHALGTVDEYLEKATELGLDEFGFAEHSCWMAAQTEDCRLCPTKDEMLTYFQWMDERRNKYNGTNGRPILRVGLEADWVPQSLDEARELIASYPFDYIIGSVHHVPAQSNGDWRMTWHFTPEETDRQLELYFESLRQMARSKFCDIIGHIDVIRRGGLIPTETLVQHVESIIPDLVEGGVAVEINTSGRDHGVGSFFPSREALEVLVKAGVPITFGSDSHSPKTVGRYLPEAAQLLRDIGAKSFARFERRKMIPVPLD